MKLTVDFRPTVYMRDKTHTYLWVRDGRSYGQFLTMDSGTITLEKLPIIEEPVTNSSGKVTGHTRAYRVYESKQQFWDLEPKNYDFLKAVEKYHSSLLQRSRPAEREMRVILGLEPLGEDDDVPTPTRPPRPVRGPAEARPEPSKKAKPVKDSAAGGYTLAQLCAELKLDPTEARKTLRSKKVEKPGGRWEWPNAQAAEAVRKALS